MNLLKGVSYLLPNFEDFNVMEPWRTAGQCRVR